MPIDLSAHGQISTNLKDRFYAGGSDTIYRFDKSGIIAGTWSIGAGGSLNGLAPSLDESILYYTRTGTGTGSELPVKRWDLVNNVALSDLAASIPGTRTAHNVLGDGGRFDLVPGTGRFHRLRRSGAITRPAWCSTPLPSHRIRGPATSNICNSIPSTVVCFWWSSKATPRGTSRGFRRRLDSSSTSSRRRSRVMAPRWTARPSSAPRSRARFSS